MGEPERGLARRLVRGRHSYRGRVPGDVPPGVRSEPVWSARLSGSGAVARPVGSSVALITPHDDGSTVEFRDAATGAGRATVEMTGKPVATTWHGRPALVAKTVKKTPSDGISPEKTAWLIDAFDEQGRRIAHKEVPGRDEPRIVDGRQIVQENGKGNSPGALVISDAGGDAPAWRIPCKGYSCMDDGATVAAGIVVHRQDGAKSADPDTLTGFDAATGTVLWSPQNLARPAGGGRRGPGGRRPGQREAGPSPGTRANRAQPSPTP
ncbi:hypothetical protein ACU686_15205 [Yinghuangia aomiensis]